MLTGSALVRVIFLLAAAAAIAGAVQFVWYGGPDAPDVAAPTAPAAADPVAERPAEREPAPSAPVARATPAPAVAATMPTPPAPPPSQAPAPPPPPPSPAAGEAEIGTAESGAEPRAVALVDLNTAGVADLNRLKGGGAIGRSIVAHRPYASVDQLLSKRVLSRAVYQRIRDQVIVR